MLTQYHSYKSEAQAINDLKNMPLYTQVFAHIHHCAQQSYSLAKAKAPYEPVNILKENLELAQYNVTKVSDTPGLYAYLLEPIDPQQAKDVILLFRGTDFSSLNSALINFELGGPGVETFPKEEKKLLKKLSNALKKSNVDTLRIVGHSQGATMSLLMTEALLRARENTHDFDGLSSLVINCLNTPGVPSQIAQSIDQSIMRGLNDYVTNQGQKVKAPLEVCANFGMVGGDIVQITGLDMPFARLEPEYATVNLLKLKGFEGHWLKQFDLADGLQPLEVLQAFKAGIMGTIGAHSNVHFFSPYENQTSHITVPHPGEHNFYTNLNKEDIPEIKKELLNKQTTLSQGFYALQAFCKKTRANLPYSTIKQCGKNVLNWLHVPQDRSHSIARL